MNVLVTGSHGLIGRALWARLAARGDHATALVHDTAGTTMSAGALSWDPAAGTIDIDGLGAAGPFDAAVHLAGAGVADRRWTPARRRLILESRVLSTGLLATTLAGLTHRPPVLVSGSAVGYYGDRGNEILTEDKSPGQGFLPDVCVAWEGATAPAESAGLRVVHLRTGVVLAGSGGMLGQLLPVFRKGLGGRLGSGRQWVSWISLDDVVSVILRAIDDKGLSGPVNSTAPTPVPNAVLTHSMAKALHRPARLAVPRVAVGLALGRDMAGEMLFASQRVTPKVLLDRGFEFTHPDVDSALRWALGT